MNLDLVRKSLSVTSHLLPEHTICKRGSILKGEQEISSSLKQRYLSAGTHLLSAVVGKDISTQEMAGASETPMSSGYFCFLALGVPSSAPRDSCRHGGASGLSIPSNFKDTHNWCGKDRAQLGWIICYLKMLLTDGKAVLEHCEHNRFWDRVLKRTDFSEKLDFCQNDLFHSKCLLCIENWKEISKIG